MRRAFVGSAAVATALGWLQLSPAFGAPVTAPAGMLDRLLGADREAGAAGWAILLLGEAAFVAVYFLTVEGRPERRLAPIAFAVGAWLVSGAIVMPLVGLLQGAPPRGALANDPMTASFFMLNLGIGAAGASLVAWLLFVLVLAAGRTVTIGPRVLSLVLAAVVVAGAIALAAPGLLAAEGSGRIVEARVPALPTPPVFISVLELPQPPGAVLGPHTHVAGFVADVSGTATSMIAGTVVDVGAGDAMFIGNLVEHDHENRAGIPLAISFALLLVGMTVALVLHRGRRLAVGLTAALLVVGTLATIDPLMNHWYFVAVRPAAQRGLAMPVPAGHRTYESAELTGLLGGPQRERLTDRRLGAGTILRFAGPAAVVVLDGQVALTVDGHESDLSAQAGATIAGGTEAMVRSGTSGARIMVVQVLAEP